MTAPPALRPRSTDVRTPPVEPLPLTTGRPAPLTTPPGSEDRVRDAEFPARELAGSRLGERETLEPELRGLDARDPPPELLELPLELEPDDPEDPEDPDEPELEPDEPLPRGMACAAARLGAASATETARLRARRIEVAMARAPEVGTGPLAIGTQCNSTAMGFARKHLTFLSLPADLSCGLALPGGRHYDAKRGQVLDYQFSGSRSKL
jgi:hypothetical protein